MKLYFLCTGNSCRSQMAEGFTVERCVDSHGGQCGDAPDGG